MSGAAQTFAPGEFLKEEMDARGWSQVELAEIMGRPTKLVNEIIAGKKAITPETAVQLGEALGTGPELWMNLESQYQLSKVEAGDESISKRAALYERFPVRDMIKRGWIDPCESVQMLERRFLAFFSMEKITDQPAFAHAAKKSGSAEMVQLAWLLRARMIAKELAFRKYDRKRLQDSLEALSALRTAPEEVRHVARILADCGVRLVIVESLPGSKIDGACFWLENDQPVVALSLRLDRIDNFWFVLRHELEHVLLGHGKGEFIVDQDIEGMDPTAIAEEERLANAAAAEFCVPQAQLVDFINRVNPYFSEERVVLFARRLGIHIGIVAGQLRRRLNRYDRWSQHLAKVRDIVTKSAPVDGWGLVDYS